MPEDFLTFRKFKDEILAQAFIEKLHALDIPFETEDNMQFYDPTMAFNPMNREIRIKLKPEDFVKAQKELESYYNELTNTADKDYYLYNFTDIELAEILTKPDEWGDFDYQLAQKILAERGIEFKPEAVQLLQKQRNEELARPDSFNQYLLYLGYFFAIAGIIFGLIIGWHLSYSKKTLPDGKSIYRYSENERDHGTRIILLSAFCSVLLVIVRWYLIRGGLIL